MIYTFLVDSAEKSFRLHTPIDNLNGHLKIKLLSASMPLRFFNVRESTTIQWADMVELRDDDGNVEGEERQNLNDIVIEEGIYDVSEIIRILDNLNFDWLELTWFEESNKLQTHVRPGHAIRLNKIGEILGLSRGWSSHGPQISYPIRDTVGSVLIFL